MSRPLLLAALLACAIALPATAEERREAGAHVHGNGQLDIAIEGGKVSIGLDAPAADILGFEHAPQTSAEKAKLDQAVAKLKDAGRMFATPVAAGCKVIKAEAGLEAPDPAKKQDHADFSGAFELQCSAIAELTTIELGYFAAFAGARSLAVTIVTGKAQTTREATRANPRIDLKGLN